METTRQMVDKFSENFDRRQREAELARIASLTPAEKLQADIENLGNALAALDDQSHPGALALIAAIQDRTDQLNQLV